MKRTSVLWLVLIQWTLAFEWLHSGWGKWSTSGFIDNIGKTLEGFAAKTPFTGYAAFLRGTAIPNATTFGNLIRSGEILVGVGMLVFGIILLSQKRLHPVSNWLLIVALLGAAAMNLNFYFAAGWSSPSTWGVNVVMGITELILALHYITNRRELTA